MNDPLQGGGRILGEVCHFVDLLCFLTAARRWKLKRAACPMQANTVMTMLYVRCALPMVRKAPLAIWPMATTYFKERIEVFGGGSVAMLEDFRRLELIRDGNKRVLRSRLRQDKGHRGEFEAFVAAIQTGSVSPIPLREIVSTMLARSHWRNRGV